MVWLAIGNGRFCPFKLGMDQAVLRPDSQTPIPNSCVKIQLNSVGIPWNKPKHLFNLLSRDHFARRQKKTLEDINSLCKLALPHCGQNYYIVCCNKQFLLHVISHKNRKKSLYRDGLGMPSCKGKTHQWPQHCKENAQAESLCTKNETL